MDKYLKKIIWLVLIAPAAYLAIIWNQLPEKVALHFNFHGTPDRYGSKIELVIGIAVLTGVAAAIYLFLPLVYKIDPKKTASGNKTSLQRLAFAIAVFMSFVSYIVIDSVKRGNIHLNIRLIFGGIGLLWCIMGNYMHTIKPNYFAGFRLPWTLNNDENWRKTHLLASKLWFAGGLLIIIGCIAAPVIIATVIFILVTIPIVVVPCVYSYRLYKKQKALNAINK